MAAEQWNFDPVHSSIGFWVRHLMVSKVHGRFNKWSGTLAFDEKNPTGSSAQVKIEAASIYTEEVQRDTHLQSADFLDVQKYPSIEFSSTSVERGGEGMVVKGDLTIHGVKKQVTLEAEYAGRVKDLWGGERIGFTARTAISRKDFGLVWNQTLEAGGVLVGDKVEIVIEIEAIKAAAKAA